MVQKQPSQSKVEDKLDKLDTKEESDKFNVFLEGLLGKPSDESSKNSLKRQRTSESSNNDFGRTLKFQAANSDNSDTPKMFQQKKL